MPWLTNYQRTTLLNSGKNIGDAYGVENITDMWYSHYEQLFNCVPNSRCKDDVEQTIEFDANQIVNTDEVRTYINNIPNGKSSGLDGLSNEHIKYADRLIDVIQAKFFHIYYYSQCDSK